MRALKRNGERRNVCAPREGRSSTDLHCVERAALVTGLVLAGGRSLRFGRDKALHRVGGLSMVERVLLHLQELCDTVFIATGADPRRTDLFHFEEALCVIDKYEDGGPLAGIHAGMRATNTAWLLVAPCDMPNLDDDTFRRILNAAAPDIEAVVTRDPTGRLVPVCGCYRTTLAPQIARSLWLGRRAVTEFVHGLDTVTLSLSAREAVNVNRPADLSALDTVRSPDSAAG